MSAALSQPWRLRLGITIVLAGALSYPAAAEKLRVTYPNLNGSYIYFFGALERGYYKEEGLDLEVIEAGGGTATAALASGDVQFSTSGSSAVSAIMKGAPLKVLLVGEDRPDWQIWSSNPGIRTLEDLKGKQIGIISRGDTGEIGIRYLLMKRGLPGDYVAFTPFGSAVATRLAVMTTGSLPAGILRPADVELLRGHGGLGSAHLVADLAQEVRSTFNGLATSDAMIKDHPDVVMKFVRATVKGMIFMRDDRADSIALFAKYMKTTPDEVAAEYDFLRRLMAPESAIPPDLQATEIALRGEMMKLPAAERPAPGAVFDFSWTQRAYSELEREGWKPQ